MQAVRAGVLPRLMQLMCASGSTEQVCSSAAGALVSIAGGLQTSDQPIAQAQAELAAADAIPTAARLLGGQGSPVLQRGAALIICILARDNAALSAERMAAGVAPSLLRIANHAQQQQ